MILYREALGVIEKIAMGHLSSAEQCGLGDATGRILGADLISSTEVPSFMNSAMDGFAVFAEDTREATGTRPVVIPVCGMVAAGDVKAFRAAKNVTRGFSVEIMTGAPLPECGFDAVVRIEDVQVERADDGSARSILIRRPCRAGENVRHPGTDFKLGQKVLSAGVCLNPHHVLACASLGMSEVSVRVRPRVAVISTGSELVSPETQYLEPGMIRNSTGPFLVSVARRMNLDVKFFGIVRDDPKLYRSQLELMLSEGVDVILSTGAVSVGQYDFVSDVLSKMGARTLFHKAAIRPGKPLLFAEFRSSSDRAVFFGLPGNPMATAVGMRFFVDHYLRISLGLLPERVLFATLGSDYSKPDGLRCFFKGHASLGERGIQVEVLKGQSSYIVSATLDANCWVVLPESGVQVKKGTNVEIYPLQHSFDSGILF